MLDEPTIRAMIAGGESSAVEFKIKPPRPAELAERMCGMANTRMGGTILLGIADATGEIVGIKRVNEAIDLILRATRTVKPPITLREAGPYATEIDGHTLLVAQVPPSDGTLYQASGVFWVRKGTNTLPMTSLEVGSHLHTSGAVRWERNVCLRATLDDLDQARLDQYLQLRSQQRVSQRHTSHEELLLGMECLAHDQESGQLRPTNTPARWTATLALGSLFRRHTLYG